MVANPYRDLKALLDTTRRLDPEEMAELHLEQGFVDRALAIYEELVLADPDNAGYQTRRAWLARMAAKMPKPEPSRSAEIEEHIENVEHIESRVSSVESTIYGVPAPKLVRRAKIVGVR